jgi:hypothetical protein
MPFYFHKLFNRPRSPSDRSYRQKSQPFALKPSTCLEHLHFRCSEYPQSSKQLRQSARVTSANASVTAACESSTVRASSVRTIDRFGLGPDRLDRTEVRRVRRQGRHPAAGDLVARQVVHHHDHPRPTRRDQAVGDERAEDVGVGGGAGRPCLRKRGTRPGNPAVAH